MHSLLLQCGKGRKATSVPPHANGTSTSVYLFSYRETRCCSPSQLYVKMMALGIVPCPGAGVSHNSAGVCPGELPAPSHGDLGCERKRGPRLSKKPPPYFSFEAHPSQVPPTDRIFKVLSLFCGQKTQVLPTEVPVPSLSVLIWPCVLSKSRTAGHHEA